MITIVYSTHKGEEYNKKFKSHLLDTVGVNNVQILEYENYQQYSLSEVYNKGIENSNFDIIVCCHNDIKLEKGWGKKLLKDFEENPDFGIIGKAGSCYFPESGIYWEKMQQTMVGQVYHHPEGSKKWLSTYSPKLPFLVPVVTVDGLFISFNKTKIKHMFDKTIGKFHFYDHPFCLSNYLDGVKLGVTSSFEITHQSVGQPNEEFFNSKNVFLEKFGNKLPLDLKPNSVYYPEISKKNLKGANKVAVIIPTKGKVELLIQTIISLYENCSTELFDIFIADTGSESSDIEIIENFIKKYENITLIKYDFYNFAKINNDVVKNYVSEQYEFILFCNNDIKILNDVVYGMVKILKEHPTAGTVGCRLHYEDNTIQHDGVFGYIDKTKTFKVSHSNLRAYYNFTPTIKKVFANTAALMMIRKNTFLRCGMFNEIYETCLEDVELNLKCICLGYENYYDGSLVSYHFRSQTRGNNDYSFNMEKKDLNEKLFPFVMNNIQKLGKYILVQN